MNPKYKQGSGLAAAAALMAAFMGAGGGVISASPEAGQVFAKLNTQARERGQERMAFIRAMPANAAAQRSQWLAIRRTRQSFGGGGWTVRHGQRLARKARNVQANRRAHRG